MTATVSVYFLFDGPLLIYVGHTRNLPRRIARHRQEGWKYFDGWGAFRTEAKIGRQMGRWYIDCYRPRYNDLDRMFRPRRYRPSSPIAATC